MLLELLSALVMALVLVISCGSAEAAPARTSNVTANFSPAPNHKAIRVYQKHSFLGRGHLTIGANGVRIENVDKLGFILVAKAPDWRVTIFRNDDKTYFTESFKEFDDTGLFSGFVMMPPGMRTSNAGYDKSVFKYSGYDCVRMTGSRTTLKYIPLRNMPIHMECILYAAYKTPTNAGLPLTYVQTHSGKDYTTGSSREGLRETVLDTSKIEQVADDPKLFESPHGYKLAKSLGVVFAGTNVRNDSVEFQSLFDLKPLGAKSQK